MLVVDFNELLLSLVIESLMFGNGLHPGLELDDVVAVDIDTVPEAFKLTGRVLVVRVCDAVLVAIEPVDIITVVEVVVQVVATGLVVTHQGILVCVKEREEGNQLFVAIDI